MSISEDGSREAMSGTISLYADDSERLHTINIGGAPEHGKGTFLKRMGHEIAHVKALYPNANSVELAHGAKCNWTFLADHTNFQIIDFWHVAEYFETVAKALYPNDEQARRQWLEQTRHRLKNDPNAAGDILEQLREIATGTLRAASKTEIDGVVTLETSSVGHILVG